MAKGPEDKRRRLRSIEGGLAGLPRDFIRGDAFDFGSVDWIAMHTRTAQSIVDAFNSEPARAASDLSIWNVDVENNELVQTMNDWQNFPDKEGFEKACAYAREYLRRVEAGTIAP